MALIISFLKLYSRADICRIIFSWILQGLSTLALSESSHKFSNIHSSVGFDIYKYKHVQVSHYS